MPGHLFVYGTLRRGLENPFARRLAQQAVWAGEAHTRGRLYDLGRYPGLQISSADEWVAGDVYRLEEAAATLAALDRYEGETFARVRSMVRMESGDKLAAWMYVYNLRVRESTRIACGDYVRHLQAAARPPAHM